MVLFSRENTEETGERRSQRIGAQPLTFRESTSAIESSLDQGTATSSIQRPHPPPLTDFGQRQDSDLSSPQSPRLLNAVNRLFSSRHSPGSPTSSSTNFFGGEKSEGIVDARSSLEPAGEKSGALEKRKNTRDRRESEGPRGKNPAINSRKTQLKNMLENSNVSSMLGKGVDESTGAIARAKAMIIGSMAFKGMLQAAGELMPDMPKDEEKRKQSFRTDKRGTGVPAGIQHLASSTMFSETPGSSSRGLSRAFGGAAGNPSKKTSIHAEEPVFVATPPSKGHGNVQAAKDSTMMIRNKGEIKQLIDADQRHSLTFHPGQQAEGHSAPGSPSNKSPSHQNPAIPDVLTYHERKKRRFSDELPMQLRTPPPQEAGLAKVPIFQGCDHDFISALALYCKKHSLSAGEVIALDPLTLTVVCSGTVHVEIQRQLVEVLHEGQGFGEPGMLGAPNNPLLTLRVPMAEGKLTFAKVCHISAKTFKAVLSTHPRERSRFTDLTFQILYKADPFKTIHFVDVLKRAEWLNTALLRCAYRRILAPQQVITVEGEEAPKGLVMVRSGTVILSIGGCEIRRIGSGQTIGETMLFGVSSIWSITAVCETICDIQIMNRMAFSRSIPDIGPKEMVEIQQLLGLCAQGRKRQSVIHHMETMEVLKSSLLFSGSSESFLNALNKCLEERVYMPGQVIIESGSEEDSLYYINNGIAEEDLSMLVENRRSSTRPEVGRQSVTGGGRKETLSRGAVFGVQQFLGLKPRHLTSLHARSLCPIQVLHRKVFLLVLDEFPKEPAAPEIQRLLEDDIEHREFDLSIGGGVSQTVRELPLLKGCTEGFVARVWASFQRRIHPPGQNIVRENHDIEELFVINRGDASASIGGHEIRKLGKGGYIGDVAILGEQSRRATVTITVGSATETWVLHRQAFQTVLDDFPKEKERFGNAAMLIIPSLVTDAQVRPRADAELRNRRCLAQASKTEQRQMSHLDFFGGCSESFLEEIQHRMEERLYIEGQKIMAEGGDGDCMFILYRGTCEVHAGNTRLSELTEGAVFGDLCVLGLTKCRDATIFAHGFCTVHVLHKSIFDASLADHPDQKEHFERIALARLDGSTTDTFSLPDTPFFTDCDLRFLELLEAHLQTILYPAASVILQEGSESEALWILSLGDATKEAGGVEQGCLGPGDTFGVALVLGIIKKSDFGVRAQHLCVVRKISAEFLLRSIQSFPKEAKLFVEDAAAGMSLTLPEVTNISLFHGVNQRFTEQLAAAVDWRTVLPGTLITSQGAPGNAMYFILFGEVVNEYEGEVVAGKPLGPGYSWGELNVLQIDKKYRQSTRARTICHMRYLTVTKFEKLLVAFPGERMKFEQMAKSMKNADLEREDIMKSQVQTVKVQKRMEGAFNHHVGNQHIGIDQRRHNQNPDADPTSPSSSPSPSPRHQAVKAKALPKSGNDRKKKLRRHAMSVAVANLGSDEEGTNSNRFFSAVTNAHMPGFKKNNTINAAADKLAKYAVGRKNAILRGKVLRLAHQGAYLDDQLRGMQRLDDNELENLETVGVLPDQATTAPMSQAARDLQAMRPSAPSKEQAVERTFSWLMGRSIRKYE